MVVFSPTSPSIVTLSAPPPQPPPATSAQSTKFMSFSFSVPSFSSYRSDASTSSSTPTTTTIVKQDEEQFVCISVASEDGSGQKSFEEVRIDDYLKAYSTTGRPPQPCPQEPKLPAERAALGLPPLFEPTKISKTSNVSDLPEWQTFSAPLSSAEGSIYSITALNEYSAFSFEEIRYQAYRKGKITPPTTIQMSPFTPTPSGPTSTPTSSSNGIQYGGDTKETFLSITSRPEYALHSFENLVQRMPLAGSVTTPSTFDADLRNRHIVYVYDIPSKYTSSGRDEKWKYEVWFFNEDRIVYAIHGGSMAGRKNYQAATYQCIRPGELWQINWTEETGTIGSMVFDMKERRVSTMANFSEGHWIRPNEAHGDKRNPEDFERWRGLAGAGTRMPDTRVMMCEQGVVLEDFRGAGDLEGIDMSWSCL
ncbi:hypothetical protein V5O48_002580 [Marasmius crinis-equi]|uniref:Uncharacterized protein n=1 Tax=Marasmius crinis-equi TaxID=585013 RepID=A0ABR3FV79_9AGAR